MILKDPLPTYLPTARACDTKIPLAMHRSHRHQKLGAGTDAMIFRIFSPKNAAKKWAFLTQNKAKLCKNVIITFGF
jgi:hypothetical protein